MCSRRLEFWRGGSERGAEVGELGTGQACRRRSTTYFQRAGILSVMGNYGEVMRKGVK